MSATFCSGNEHRDHDPIQHGEVECPLCRALASRDLWCEDYKAEREQREGVEQAWGDTQRARDVLVGIVRSLTEERDALRRIAAGLESNQVALSARLAECVQRIEALRCERQAVAS